MKNIFSGFRGGIVWVILAVLIVAVSLTAQTPKSPTSNQSVSEVGRYVFWSTPTAESGFKWGFLDTKRGRVWEYNIHIPGIPYEEWSYSDLNEELIRDYEYSHYRIYKDLIKDDLKEGKDTTGLWETYEKEIQSKLASYKEKIRQKEK